MPTHTFLPNASTWQRFVDLLDALITAVKLALGLVPMRYRINNRADLHRKIRRAIAAAGLFQWPLCILCISLLGFVLASGCSPTNTENHSVAKAPAQPVKKEVGAASWYGPGFHGKETANGETFDQKELTAAHPTLPMDTKANITNLENGKKVEVRINDRGPFIGNRVIDLSKAAAKKLDMQKDGTTEVKIETKAVKTKPDPKTK